MLDASPTTAPATGNWLDLAYWRWLCAGLPGCADPANEQTQRVPAELGRLAEAPQEAAELVPRVPEVIPQLLRSMRDDSVSAADLARQLAQDPVLVAEVIREANSPFYPSSASCTRSTRLAEEG